MAAPSRRAHIRILCDHPAEVFLGTMTGRRLGDGRLLDVSFSGAYLSIDADLQNGTPYRLRLKDAEGSWEPAFRVVREGARHPKRPFSRNYGILFSLSAEQERRWSRLVDEMRRHPTDQETRLDRSLRGYWSG